MKKSTPQVMALVEALRERGVYVEREHSDGHKHIDIFIPEAKIYIEVDGAQHDMRPKQVFADLNRDYFSAKEGFFTKHITNQEIENHLETIANAIAKVVKESSNKMGDNLHKLK